MGSVEGRVGGGLRLKILGSLLLIAAVAWGMSYIQTRDLTNELNRVAEDKIREFVGPQEGDALEVATPLVTVSRRYILFGETTGKVAVYMRSIESGDSGRISGIEFFLGKEDGEWRDLESGECSSEQCQVEGKSAFARGMHVRSAN